MKTAIATWKKSTGPLPYQPDIYGNINREKDKQNLELQYGITNSIENPSLIHFLVPGEPNSTYPEATTSIFQSIMLPSNNQTMKVIDLEESYNSSMKTMESIQPLKCILVLSQKLIKTFDEFQYNHNAADQLKIMMKSLIVLFGHEDYGLVATSRK